MFKLKILNYKFFFFFIKNGNMRQTIYFESFLKKFTSKISMIF